MMEDVRGAFVAAVLAPMVAKVQVAHYREFMLAGMGEERAERMTMATTEKLLSVAPDLITATEPMFANASAILRAIRELLGDPEVRAILGVNDDTRMTPEQFIEKVKPALEHEFSGTHNSSFAIRTMRDTLGLS